MSMTSETVEPRAEGLVASPARRGLQALAGLAGGAIRRNRLFVGLVGLHWLTAATVAEGLGVRFNTGIFDILTLIFALLIPAFLFALLVWRAAWMAAFVRPERPSAWLIADIRRNVLVPDRLADGLIALLATTLFCGSFAFLKAAIPLIDNFSWDPFFAHLDRTLLGGHDAYQLLLPLAGPWLVTAVNAAYNFWMFLMFFILFVACFATGNRRARDTFLIAFVLTWALGGNLMATAFASAGPVYYQSLGFGAEFAPLMETLRHYNTISPVWSLDVQKMLWQGYAHGGAVAGISAFPSMHIASSTLLTLYAFRYRRWAGWLMVAFTAMIMVGSVLLGWHYAVDAVGGGLCTLAAWKFADWRVSRRAEAVQPAK